MEVRLCNLLKTLKPDTYEWLTDSSADSALVAEIMVMATPDVENWIIDDELILTSLYGLSGAEQKRLVTKLASRHASGVIVKCNQFLKKVPSHFVDLCQQFHIPLIQMTSVKYRQIIDNFHRLQQTSELVLLSEDEENFIKRVCAAKLTKIDEHKLEKHFNAESLPLKCFSLNSRIDNIDSLQKIIRIIRQFSTLAIIGIVDNFLYWIDNDIQQDMVSKFKTMNGQYKVVCSATQQAPTLPTGFRQVVDTRKMANGLSLEGDVVSYDQLTIEKLFLETSPQKLRRILITPTVEKLFRDNTMLFVSLRCYFRCNQNVSRTAKILYVHPKTMSYRLRKIENLLQIDMKDRGATLQLNLAVLFLTLQEKGVFETSTSYE